MAERLWTVALSGGPMDGEVVRVGALGRRLVGRTNLFSDGTLTRVLYAYTGLAKRQRVAFARYDCEEPLTRGAPIRRM